MTFSSGLWTSFKSTCRPCHFNSVSRLFRYYASNTTPRDYKAAVAALDSLQSNVSIIQAIGTSGRSMNKLAIPEMLDWLRRIGYEPSDLNSFNPIHIAGTKGKSSTSAFISSILSNCCSPEVRKSTRKIGLYTSPHLRHVQERIQINNNPLSEILFARYFFEIWDRLDSSAKIFGPQNFALDAAGKVTTLPANTGGSTKPTYFRFLTLLAFHTFISEGVCTAVIECGIGGEYDSTNIIPSPTVSAITSLGIDHTAILGDTIEDIAWHKSGIFKAEARCHEVFTVDSQLEAAMHVLEQRAAAKGLTLVPVARHCSLVPSASDEVNLDKSADYQRTNSSLAIAVSAAHLRCLGVRELPSGCALPDPLDFSTPLPPEFKRGLEMTRWSGRCEVRREGKTTWHLDGGHTIESVNLAAEWFGACMQSSKRESRRRILLFNQSTRDAAVLARMLFATLEALRVKTETGKGLPTFDCAIFCTNTRFAVSGGVAESLVLQQELAQLWKELDSDCVVEVHSTIEDAVAAVQKLQDQGAVQELDVLVTGSLYLVGGVLEVLDERIQR